jgi:hypothetical protein
MPGDRRDLHRVQPELEEPRGGLVPQVVEPQALDAGPGVQGIRTPRFALGRSISKLGMRVESERAWLAVGAVSAAADIEWGCD